jgi:hypothetical protein
MIREKQKHEGPIVIDLTGPDGNAHALMSYARRFCNDLDIPVEPILEKMMSGDYENLLSVFDDTFGEYVILER